MCTHIVCIAQRVLKYGVISWCFADAYIRYSADIAMLSKV